MALALTLLGSFQAFQADQPLTFATNAARALLAYLAIEGDHPQPRELLAALLWPDVPQIAALANLRQTLVRLRKALADSTDSADSLLHITPQTIQLRQEIISVDVIRFEALLAACETHVHDDLTHCPDCVARMQQAIGLYQGEFLRGLSLDNSQSFEEWLLFRREALHQQALQTLHVLAQHYELGRQYEAMRRAAAHRVAMEPWHEAAHLQLMLALAHLGQRAAALAQFDTCRNILQTELGIEPSTEFVALYERIRAGMEGAGLLATSSAVLPQHNLPEHLTAFVGRENVLTQVAARMRNASATDRLLTFVGPGGMGKTRLSLEVARSCLDAFPEGVFFVSLAPLNAASAIVPAIASALGLSLQGGDLRQALLNALRAKRLLLILDNYEHVIEGAEIAAEILHSAPAVQIIATSRERLNVRGESVFNVEGMAYSPKLTLADAQTSEAVRMFVQAAHRAQPTFKLNEATLPAVLRICGLVQGVPLGLELAAAWAESLSLDTIAAEIEANTDFLAFDWRDLPERQRSMRAVFQWSWNLLSDTERNIFMRLSVFRGGFTHQAAHAVADASLTALTRLAHKSLLRRAEGGRYDLHELVRQFAAEQLRAASNAFAQTDSRHASYFMDFLAAREQRLARHEPRQATSEIRAEIDNVRKAWETVCACLNGRDGQNIHDKRMAIDELGRNAFVLSQFYLYTGLYSDGEWMMSSAVKHLNQELEENQNSQNMAQGRRVLSKLLAINARFFTAAGKNDAALPIAQQAIAIGVAAEAVEGEAIGYLILGMVLCRSGQYQAAQLHLEQALQLARHPPSNGLPTESLYEVESSALIWLSVNKFGSNFAAARSYLAEALRLAQSRGNLRLEMVIRVNLANCARGMSDYALAKEEYERAMHMAHDLNFPWGEAAALTELGDVVRMLGDYGLAQTLNERALMIFRDMGDYVKEAHAMYLFARLDILRGRYAQAQVWLEQLWQVIRTAANLEAEVIGFMVQALLSLYTGQQAQAVKFADQAIQLAIKSDDRTQQACALTLLGHGYMRLNDLSQAQSAYEQALHIFAQLNQIYQAVEPQAGLVQIALERGELALAQSHVESILAVQKDHPRAGLDEPFFAYLMCYQVMAAANDPRAATLLEQACTLLKDYATHIDDETLRESFLHNVPTHRELWALWQTEGVCRD